MSKMKPCPFCGETPNAVTMKSAGYGEIVCEECEIVFRFITADCIADVIEAWNRRRGDETN